MDLFCNERFFEFLKLNPRDLIARGLPYLFKRIFRNNKTVVADWLFELSNLLVVTNFLTFGKIGTRFEMKISQLDAKLNILVKYAQVPFARS